jgi:hypothetical protein
MHSQFRLLMMALGLTWLLSACTLQANTVVTPGGAGELRVEIGMTAVEQQMMRSLGNSPDAICRELQTMAELPEGTTMGVEERGMELWCVFGRPFADLDELAFLYADMGWATVNQLSIVDEVFTYDIQAQALGMDLPDIPLAGIDVRWQVTMPGRILNHNAERVSGATLSWSLATDQPMRMQATSDLSGGVQPVTFAANRLTWLAAAILLVCCCGALAAAAGAGVLLFTRRRRRAAAPA